MFDIQPIRQTLNDEIQRKINTKTKPLGALGVLEEIGSQMCKIQHTLTPQISKPTMLVFAGDHGIANSGVSPYPQEVTFQMVYNFLQGGAAINVFAKQNGWNLKVIDAGVAHEFEPTDALINLKVSPSTKNVLEEPAMSENQFHEAVSRASDLVKSISEKGTNLISFGEMGIGNTSSAALIMHYITNEPIEVCAGRGTGLDDTGLKNKVEILKQVIKTHGNLTDPTIIAQTVGGFEIVMIMAGILKAAEEGMTILIDGFIVSSALLLAHALNPHILGYCIFAHQSNEKGHKKMLSYLKAKPLLHLGMRLGEGTGAAICLPLLQSSIQFINEMASFESARVSDKSDA